MKRPKYIYAIVDKENGDMLLQDSKLPFYWLKSVAKERCKNFNKCCVVRLNQLDFEKLVISGKII